MKYQIWSGVVVKCIGISQHADPDMHQDKPAMTRIAVQKLGAAPHLYIELDLPEVRCTHGSMFWLKQLPSPLLCFPKKPCISANLSEDFYSRYQLWIE